MPRIVDARGLPCPQPVILTRSAMREEDEITTLVSAQDQVENVSRLATRAGWSVDTASTDQGYAVHITRGTDSAGPELTPDLATCALAGKPATVMVLSGDTMGRGDASLGGVLMRALLHTLTEVEPLPRTLILFNAGIKLAVEGSPVVDDLLALQEAGVEILVCGTCLGYFDLKDHLAAGVVSNMYTIAETMLSAPRIVVL